MQTALAQRPPSTQWEPLPIVRVPGLTLWAWFRPQNSSTVTINIPEPLLTAYPTGFPFTVGDILESTGLDWRYLAAVSLFGGEPQPAAVFLPYLNHPVPLPVVGTAPEISIQFADYPAAEQAAVPAMASGVQMAPGTPPMVGASPTAGPQPVVGMQPHASGMHGMPEVAGGPDEPTGEMSQGLMYERIDSSWRASIQMERQMSGLRQKLAGLLNSLGKLDRDLNPEERLAADREDRDAWEDARRWVRDLAGRCHREIKQFDIGMTSAAGKRNWMQQLYDQVVEPRQPCSELDTYRREFETYRKDMQNLLRAMTAAVQTASQNGTQRAQRVLGVISRKIRERRAKMREPIAGANMDKTCRRKR